MRDTERDMLEATILALESELAALHETSAALVAEVAKLATERDDLRRAIERDDLRRAMETELVSVGPSEDGSVETRFRCEWAVKALAASFADFLAEAPNWRSVVVGPLPWTGGSLVVTVQRADGTTPAETIDGLKERLSRLLNKARPVPKAEKPGTDGWLICLSDSEWDYVRGTP